VICSLNITIQIIDIIKDDGSMYGSRQEFVIGASLSEPHTSESFNQTYHIWSYIHSMVSQNLDTKEMSVYLPIFGCIYIQWYHGTQTLATHS